jgi:hypothetical protein
VPPRIWITFLLLLSACATMDPGPGEWEAPSPSLANLQRAAQYPWTDDGQCVVREASNDWPVLAERCFYALDRDRVRFRDVTRKCAVAYAAAVPVGVALCVFASPAVITGAVIVIGTVVVAVAIKEGIDAYERNASRERAKSKTQTRPSREQDPVANSEPKPKGLGRDWLPPISSDSPSSSWTGVDMSFDQNQIIISVFAPALEGDDARPLAIVHGMERALPGLRLGWTTSEKDDLIPLPHRDEWVASDRTDGGFPFLCNDDDNATVTLFGLEDPNGLYAGGPPHLAVHASLSSHAAGLAAAADVLAALGESARAYWGHATPSKATVEISRQTLDPVRKPGTPPRGLPALRFPDYNRAPEVPHCLGWLNYWSAAAARAIGFSDPARDAELLTRARCTLSGGWVVQLTDAPLDLDNPAHLDALKWAYERFPEIGGRAAR